MATLEGLRSMSQYLPPGARSSPHRDFEPRVVEYLTTVLETKKDRELGVRNSRELRTLAQAIDAVLSGDLLFGVDTLMQRFKAVELASQDQGWHLAEQLELIPVQSVSSVNEQERQAAATEFLKLKRLENHARGSGQRPPQRSPFVKRQPKGNGRG